MTKLLKQITISAALALPTAVHAIGISFYSGGGPSVLDGAVLFASVAGGAPRYAVPLGRIELNDVFTDLIVDTPIGDGTSMHWWLIGDGGARIVCSGGVSTVTSVFELEPFFAADDTTIFEALVQLNAFNAGGAFSPDIAERLYERHGSLAALDKSESSVFDATSRLQLISVSLHDNIPPGFPSNPVPAPGTPFLVAMGLFGVGRMMKQRRQTDENR